jgi:flagellar secretion chaperone FliS
MPHNTSNNYLVTEVMTASAPKLHLMLLDTAIRESRRAKLNWQTDANEQVRKSINHARDIVFAIVDGIDYTTKSEMVNKLAGIYLFIYTSLTRAILDADVTRLDEAIGILEIERETWRRVCDNEPASSDKLTTIDSGHAPAAPNLFAADHNLPYSSDTSFSLEA